MVMLRGVKIVGKRCKNERRSLHGRKTEEETVRLSVITSSGVFMAKGRCTEKCSNFKRVDKYDRK